MTKLDLKKKYKTYFTAKEKPELVEIGSARYISITGKGGPNEKPFADSVEALYSTAYTLKFACKEKGQDFVVSKLEGLWWYDENKFGGKTMANAAVEVPRRAWEYRLLIRIPDYVQEEDIRKAIEAVFVKKNLQRARQVEFFTMTEGQSVQMLHVGPFSTEPQTLQKISTFMDNNKLTRNGLHHEIYLSDFRKTAPEQLKTILREPVK